MPGWEPLRQQFLLEEIVPRIPAAAVRLVESHLEAGDLVVMTTATNRVITELTAWYFGIGHLLATDVEVSDGRLTGRTCGVLNMREGKVERLTAWLSQRRHVLAAFTSTAYSDSINDLPLLEAVTHPVAVDPDPQLAAIAHERRWPVLHLHPTEPSALRRRDR
jgi:HAD superfamily hydrolase (TIGR01490 family)